MNHCAVKEIKMIISEFSGQFEDKLAKYISEISPQYEVDVQYATQGKYYTALVIVRNIMVKF